MPSRTELFWNKPYNAGRDFTLISSQDITSFLRYTSSQAPKTCLDIGCGTGQLSRELYHRGYTVTGIDVSSSAIRIAQSLSAVSDTLLHYMVVDIEKENMDLFDEDYGLITCKLVYAFMQNKEQFLKKMKQLLTSHGSLVVITPLIEDVPTKKQAIAITPEETRLLITVFPNNIQYKANGLLYFIGRLRS